MTHHHRLVVEEMETSWELEAEEMVLVEMETSLELESQEMV